MAAAAGPLCLFMEAYGLEGEEELSTLTTQYWAEGAWIGKWEKEKQNEVAYLREVQKPGWSVR